MIKQYLYFMIYKEKQMKDKKIAVKCMFVIGLILGLGYIRPLEAYAEV